MTLKEFRESGGVIEFGLESVDRSRQDYMITIHIIDVLFGVAGASFLMWLTQ